MDKQEVIDTQKNFIKWQAGFILVLVGIFGFYMYIRGHNDNTPVIAHGNLTVQTSNNSAPYINPAVTANLGKHYIINFKPLGDELQAIVSKYPYKAYVYFDYLNNAAWLGINSDKLFEAASTVKVPLAMAVLKASENGNISLNQEYTLDELNLDSRFGSLYKIGAGNSLTISQLIQIMLVYSDNTAMNALVSALGLSGIKDPFTDVYQSMGWEQFKVGDGVYNLINTVTLSNMFIALYNALYDNVADSNLILKYLDDSAFNDAIVAGVPSDVGVSHKIGDDDPDLTYSDCGVVYVPHSNYILCLGSAGADQTIANNFMAEISKTAYNFVTNN